MFDLPGPRKLALGFLNGLARAVVLPATDNSTGLILGGFAGSDCYWFPGTIDELRILDHVIDAAQVAADYQKLRLGLDAGTVGLWHFDEGSPQRCCPAGSACDATMGCLDPGTAPTCPVKCTNGKCCPGGTSCISGGALGCAVDSTLHSGACPTDKPVVCADHTCCPAGETCDPAGCQHADQLPVSPCPAGQVAVPSGPNSVSCCPAPGPGATAGLLTLTQTDPSCKLVSKFGTICVETGPNTNCFVGPCAGTGWGCCNACTGAGCQ